MKEKRINILFIFILLTGFAFAQPNELDSLKIAAKTQKVDTLRFNALMSLGNNFQGDINDSAIHYHTIAAQLAVEKKLSLQTSQSLRAIGVDKYMDAKYNDALWYLKQSLKHCELLLQTQKDSIEKEKIKFVKASVLGNIGSVYYAWSDFPMALEFYFKGLALADEMKNKRLQAFLSGNIGVVFSDLDERVKGLRYNYKALIINTELNKKIGQAINHGNIGVAYTAVADSLIKKGKLNEGQEYYKKALVHLNAANYIDGNYENKRGLAANHVSIGNVYHALGNYDEALKHYVICEKYSKETGEKRYLEPALTGIGEIYRLKKQYKEAEKYLLQSWAIVNEIKAKQMQFNSSGALSRIYDSLRMYDKAYNFYKLNVNLRDSIESEKNIKKLIQQQMQYDYEKKQQLVKAEQDKKDAIVKEEKQKQKTILYFIIFVLVLVLVFAIVMVNRFKVTQRQKRLIELKEKETNEQKLIIEEKHKEITDSINYAERIQRSLLASKEILTQNLNEFFVMFCPKDVVSGDFYWAANLNNGNFALITADSTGHGVPGAIMSILNISCIEKAVEAEKLTNPSEILNHTRKKIIETLKKDGSKEGGKDGMDCSLCVYDFKNMKLIAAAAHNPIWIVRKSESGATEVIEVKPDKMPVGKHDMQNTSFTLHEFDLQKGDVVYTLTDGFPDQFGGPKGKKFMSKNLREMLTANAHLPMEEQKQHIEKIFADWKANLEQVDDVTVIGIRV